MLYSGSKNSLWKAQNLKRVFAENYAGLLSQISGIMLESLRNGGRIFFCGNGGSAADSQHLATELVSRFCKNRPPIPAFALTADSIFLTARIQEIHITAGHILCGLIENEMHSSENGGSF